MIMLNEGNSSNINPFQSALWLACPWDEVIDLVHLQSVAPAVLRFRINGIK